MSGPTELMPLTPSSPSVPQPGSPAAAGAQPASSAASPLDDTIAVFDAMAGERLAEPVAITEEVIPVSALLYRGRAALDRAVELRDQLRTAGGPPAPELLEELYDLVELARAD